MTRNSNFFNAQICVARNVRVILEFRRKMLQKNASSNNYWHPYICFQFKKKNNNKLCIFFIKN